MNWLNMDLQRKSKKKINLMEKPKVSKPKKVSDLPFSFTEEETVSRLVLQRKKPNVQF